MARWWCNCGLGFEQISGWKGLRKHVGEEGAKRRRGHFLVKTRPKPTGLDKLMREMAKRNKRLAKTQEGIEKEMAEIAKAIEVD